jgi:hypothetical protein
MPLVCLRIFVTSRPGLLIRLGFKGISGGTYQGLVLHEIPQPKIEHDIAAFRKQGLARLETITAARSLHPDHFLPLDWPGERNIQALVNMAIPCLFLRQPCAVSLEIQDGTQKND